MSLRHRWSQIIWVHVVSHDVIPYKGQVTHNFLWLMTNKLLIGPPSPPLMHLISDKFVMLILVDARYLRLVVLVRVPRLLPSKRNSKRHNSFQRKLIENLKRLAGWSFSLVWYLCFLHGVMHDMESSVTQIKSWLVATLDRQARNKCDTN